MKPLCLDLRDRVLCSHAQPLPACRLERVDGVRQDLHQAGLCERVACLVSKASRATVYVLEAPVERRVRHVCKRIRALNEKAVFVIEEEGTRVRIEAVGHGGVGVQRSTKKAEKGYPSSA